MCEGCDENRFKSNFWRYVLMVILAFFNFNSHLQTVQGNNVVFKLKNEVIMVKENERLDMKTEIELTLNKDNIDKTTQQHYI